jgi:hypothetical protein
MMRAVCYICGGVASHRCNIDGKPVCGRHYDKRAGVCTAHRIMGEQGAAGRMK